MADNRVKDYLLAFAVGAAFVIWTAAAYNLGRQEVMRALSGAVNAPPDTLVANPPCSANDSLLRLSYDLGNKRLYFYHKPSSVLPPRLYYRTQTNTRSFQQSRGLTSSSQREDSGWRDLNCVLQYTTPDCPPGCPSCSHSCGLFAGVRKDSAGMRTQQDNVPSNSSCDLCRSAKPHNSRMDGEQGKEPSLCRCDNTRICSRSAKRAGGENVHDRERKLRTEVHSPIWASKFLFLTS